VKTLAHELAHALLHADAGDRALAELEAESVAFVVCDALGIEAAAWSFGYVATWSGGREAALAAIKSAGARIQRAVDRILSALEVGRDDVLDGPSRARS
jgi:antirestriction protein ArdC